MRVAACWFVVVGVCCTNLWAEVPPEPKYKLIPQTPPATEVNSVSVSPDGSLVASAAGEGGVRLYDAGTGKLLRVLGDVGDRCVVFSPDGRTLTAAGFHMDKLVALWDVRSGTRVRTFEGQGAWEADATAISPDGKLLASTGTDKQILVWETSTGKLKLRLKDQPARMAALAFSPDGSTLAAAGGDKAVHLWDCATGKPRRSLSGQSGWICALAFSPDGKWVASGSCEWGTHRGHNWPRSPLRGVEKCEWILWDVASGKAVRKVEDRGRLLSLAFSPDGRSLGCGIGREVRLYGLESEARPGVVTAHDGDVTSVAFSRDGTAVVSGSHDQTVKYTRVPGGEVLWRAPGSFDQVNSVALSADGSVLITGSGDWRFGRGWLAAGARQTGPGAVRVWDARTGRMVRRLGDAGEQYMAVAIAADGSRVAAGSGIGGNRGAVHVWDARSGSLIWAAKDDPAEVLAVAFFPGTARIASGTADGVVKIRDARTGSVVQTLAAHAGGASSLVFSPDGQTLFAAEAHGGARVWNAHTGKLLQTYRAPASAIQSGLFTVDRRLNTVSMTTDGRVVGLCGSGENGEYTAPFQLWDVATGAVKRDFSDEKIHGRPTVLSPDGSVVATGGKSVKLYDAHTGKLLRELYGYLKRTQSITFSADGKVLVAGGSYGTTNLWDVSTGRHLATLFAFNDPQSGAPDDAWLACTYDGFYDGSPGVGRFLAWRVGEELLTAPSLSAMLHQPDRLTDALTVLPPRQRSQN